MIDDFCFFTLFSGNDFLPSLNGNFDAQIMAYKNDVVPKMKGYIINEG